MYIFHPVHQKFLEQFIRHDVDFILIGGYAVNYHGYIRATGDMDVWLKPDNENKKKVISAFRDLNLHPDDLTKLDESFDFEQVVVFHFGNPPERIDFLTRLPGVVFNDAKQRCVKMPLKEIQIPVLHLDDLIASKLTANRPQDRTDVEILKSIHRKK